MIANLLFDFSPKEYIMLNFDLDTTHITKQCSILL